MEVSKTDGVISTWNQILRRGRWNIKNGKCQYNFHSWSGGKKS